MSRNSSDSHAGPCWHMRQGAVFHLLALVATQVQGLIGFQNERLFQICKCQYWCCHALLFEGFKCLQCGGGQGNRVVLQLAVLITGEIVQWSGDTGEVLDEMTEVPYSSNELPDSSHGGGRPHVGDLLDAFLAW